MLWNHFFFLNNAVRYINIILYIVNQIERHETFERIIMQRYGRYTWTNSRTRVCVCIFILVSQEIARARARESTMDFFFFFFFPPVCRRSERRERKLEEKKLQWKIVLYSDYHTN